jgi:hypothetical protein
VTATAVYFVVTPTPTPGGCALVSYKISHAPANSIAAPSVTTVAAHAPITAFAGNLVTGETYIATAVGVCADGTRTPPSAPVAFVPVSATCLPLGAKTGVTPALKWPEEQAYPACCSGYIGEISSTRGSAAAQCRPIDDDCTSVCCLPVGADAELVVGGEFQMGGQGAGDCCSDDCDPGTVDGRSTSCVCD